MKGTVLATDGIIIETTCPLETECRGNYVGNMSRKGFLGMVAIAAVDCNCIFKLADMKWTGGTHDAVAFCGTDLYDHMMTSKIPNNYFFK